MAGKKRVPARVKAKKEWKPQGFTKKEWITIGVVLGAIVVLVLGYFLLRDFFDGSLRISGGVVQAEDNWLLVNTGSSSKPKYFKLGAVSPVDGYEMETDYLTDQNVPTFIYSPEAPGAVDNVTLLAAKGAAQEMADRVSSSYGAYLQNAVASAPGQVTIGGRTGWAFSCDYEDPVLENAVAEAADATPAPEETPAPSKAARVVNVYFEASRGMSVLTGITAKADDAGELPSVEDLHKALEPFIEGMTIDGVDLATPAPAGESEEPAASPAA